MSKILKLFFLSLLIISCSKEAEIKPTTPLVIKTSGGEIIYSVEVATTPDELQKGLMERESMPENYGMIFNMEPVRPTAMWMKDTLIPLDMLFIAPDGSISLIYENTKPMSEDLLISRQPVRAVIELNAGQVQKNNIKVGDKVRHQILENMVELEPKPQFVPASGSGAIIPKGGIAPKTGTVPGGIAPKTGVLPGAVVPKTGAIVPKTGAVVPKTGAIPGAIVPKTGAVPLPAPEM